MPAPPLLSLSDVSVTLSDRTIVKNIGATFAEPAFVTLLGPNGAGKTTLLRAIAGLVGASGSISLGGTPLASLAPETRARRIGYLPQGHLAHWPLTVEEIVALGRYPHGAGDLHHLSQADRDIVADAMARTETTALAGRNVQTLSGGERARVMIARVLALGAPVILADEPTAALDPHHQLAVIDTLRAEARRGVLVIAVTHDLILASRFADRVIVLSQGALAGDGAPQDVLTDGLMQQVYGVRTRHVTLAGQTVTMPWSLA